MIKNKSIPTINISSIVKKSSELHTKTAKEFLENSFKSQEENNERS